eukprot:TRINITY_DN2160_c0_g1_i2.p1 TRINITY_DN2160_c0_g1~~TRINITY_DN2160_c0_g1_i2.p1  ORF type:complete len:404 (-),score=109.34 TRINITY_DN2160_c0_g1_i2:190-1401(-)
MLRSLVGSEMCIRDRSDTVQDEIRRQVLDNLGRLEGYFRSADPEGRGYISHLDFRKGLYESCGLPYSAVGVLMGDVPTVGGMVDYTKWCSQFVASSRRTAALTQDYVRTHDDLLKEVQFQIQHKFSDLRAAFRTFDTNGDGLVSLYEFKRALYLHLGVLPSHMDALFRYIDHNDSGYINYDEWLQFFAQDFNQYNARIGETTGAPISALRRRVMQREVQHAQPTPSAVPAIGQSGIPTAEFSDRSAILDMVESKVAEAQINVNPLRQMQLVDEIRELNLPPAKQVEFLRNLPITTDKKVQVFRELQLSPAHESKFLADIRAMDYLRASMKEGGNDRKGLEGLFVGPTREVALVNEIRRTPVTAGRKLGLLQDLPISTSKKLDLIHELRLVQYIDDVYKERARK